MRHCPKCGTDYADQIAFCPTDGTPTRSSDASPDRDSFLGVVIDGRYRIDEQIGEGGMGVVYRATHLVLHKPFAIKVMRGKQAHDGEVVQRFLQEARASSAIGHPNIVNISDFGATPDGAVYFAMEFLQGQTLAQAMEKGPLERARALGIFVQITAALEAAHDAGIVHRDLKPENIFLKREPENPDFVKVLDFGIAKVKGAAAKLTRTGMVFGTPHYMSPEQAAGQPVDHRSDIYSLGVIMYQVFTGQLPFDGESFMDVMTKHMYETPQFPTRNATLPAGLERILMQGLKKKPEQRQSSMRLLRDALEEVLAARESEPPRVSERPSMRESVGPASEPPVPTSAALREAARQEVLSEDESIAVPKQRRPVWVWLLIGAVLAGIGVLSFGRSREGAPDAAVPAAEAPPPSAAGSEIPPGVTPEAPKPAPGSSAQAPGNAPGAPPQAQAPSQATPPPPAVERINPAPAARPPQPAPPAPERTNPAPVSRPRPPPEPKPKRGGEIDPWR